MPTRRQQRIIRRAAGAAGIDPAILWGVYGAETNFGRNKNSSPAGAQGPFQFMPQTAASLGINPHNFRQAAFGAAKYLSRYKDRGIAGMLAAYNAGPAGNPNNPETRAYIPKVKQLARSWEGGNASGGGGGLEALLTGGGSSGPREIQGGADVSALLAALSEKPQPVSSGSLAPPAFAAQAVMPQGAGIPQGGGGPAPKPDVNALLEAVRTVGGGISRGTGSEPLTAALTGSTGGGGAKGRVRVDPAADRQGASTNRAVIDFASQIAGIAGIPVRIGTGTNHSKFTVNGNVSDHWAGNAADIPASGKRLIRLGQAALIAAGMPERQARRQTGGLFNVGGHQIIFNTQEGGDHTDHLHVSAKRRRR